MVQAAGQAVNVACVHSGPCKKDKDLWQCEVAQFKICFDPEGLLKRN